MARAARKDDTPLETTEAEHLDSLSVEELNALADRVLAVRDAKMAAERGKVIAEMREKMVAFGVTAADLEKAAKGGRKSADVKYRDDAGNSWTGRGRLPTWLANAEAEGRSRDQFLVQPTS